MNALAGRRVLLTGATGFIGAHVLRALVAEGADVRVLVRGSSPRAALRSAGARVSVVDGDMSEAASLCSAVRRAAPQVVVHLAKERGNVPFEVQAQATLRLAAALRAEAPGLERWVRTAHAAPGASDAALAAVVKDRFSLPVVTLELFQVYGPGQPASDFPVCLFDASSPPWRESGGGRKDFVHVRDVARAYILASWKPGLNGERIAIGSGRALTTSQAAEILAGILPVLRKWSPAVEGAGGHAADGRRAETLLGWVPEIDLVDGFREMIECFRRQGAE